MPARALWKAQVQLDKVSLPVRMYSAVQDRNVHFNLLHAKDHQRVHERMRRVSDGEIVEMKDTRTGYALETGELVLLEPKERSALAPKASRDIRVLHCAPRSALPMAAFARPYYLGPDGDEDELYFALADALGDRLAICEWVLRNKHHHGALTAKDGYLMLIELHSADEWIDVSELELPGGPDLEERELALAEQLIRGLDAPFEHDTFHDDYRERVHDLIERKARGEKAPRARESREPERSTSLLSALSASVKGLQKAGAREEGAAGAGTSRARAAKGERAHKRHSAARPRRAKNPQPRRQTRGQKGA